ncbi:uncharacterized protein [Montipora capricornis]|uniref:uncharacterized protein n=1 Tax=Montipora capricornis TaxID=246305 RepID=UPI0035F15D57
MMIEEHPKSQTRQEGSKVELKCKVKGGNAGNEVIYQWFKDITPMEGKTSSSLIFDPVRVRDFGVYKCEVRRSRTDRRYLTSDEAELDVTPRDGMSHSELSTVFNYQWDIRDKVAKKLTREIAGNKAWKQVALEYNMDQDDAHLLEKEKVPGDIVIDYIRTSWPTLTVYDFCKTLKKFRRLDIVEILLDYLCSQDV